MTPARRIKELIQSPLEKCYPADAPPRKRLRKWVHRARPMQMSVMHRWDRASDKVGL